MSNSEAIEKIKKLTDQEREVFKLFCEQGKPFSFAFSYGNRQW